MAIAVTGATGQLGGLAIEELLKTQPADTVVAVVRDAGKAESLAAKGVQVRVADYTDRAALEAAFAGVDRVLLISGSEVGQRVPQHQNVIDAAKAAGVQRVVYTSAPKATDTDLILAPEHKATEEYLVASGLDYTIVRNNWYTENYVNQLNAAMATGTVVTAGGEGRIASATRADLAEGAVAVLLDDAHRGKVYEFGGDHSWTYHELADTIGDIIGRPVSYQPVDADALVGILTGNGLDEGTASFVAALDTNTAAGALDVQTGDLSRVLGRPTTSLKEGLEAARA